MENKEKVKLAQEFVNTLTEQEKEALGKYSSQLMKDNLEYKAKVQSDLQKSFKEFLNNK